MNGVEEPQGVGFYKIDSDETHYLKTEPQIQAYINSSDMGINASRGQDFKWRLAAEWVEKIRQFRRDNTQMQILTSRNQGQRPTTVQILYYLYGEQLRAYQEEVEENENPYEDKYQKAIAAARRKSAKTPQTAKPVPLSELTDTEDDDISDLIDVTEEDLEPTESGVETTIKVKDGELTYPKTDSKTSTSSQKKQ